MKNKEHYYQAFIKNNGKLNEIDLGEKIYLDEDETREILSQLLSENRIKYHNNGNSNYSLVKKKNK